MLLDGHFHRLVPTGRFDDVVAVPLEHDRYYLSEIRVVVDDQNSFTHLQTCTEIVLLRETKATPVPAGRRSGVRYLWELISCGRSRLRQTPPGSCHAPGGVRKHSA